MSKLRSIAIHLPQFHPTPENDAWWGKGFTEWTNVAKAKPLFNGHYQPQLPADLGFYDLRLEESRLAQEALAKAYGIHGFCYYHYWFNGKRLLHEPVDRKLKNLKEDLPFMLCWANETWSRRWLGDETNVLMKQDYSPEDAVSHADLLKDFFRDERYIRINNRPVFVIYRPDHITDRDRYISLFKETVMKNGIEEPYLIASNSHGVEKPELFDGILNFEPQLSLLKYAFSDSFHFKRLLNNLKIQVCNGKYKVYDYNEAKDIMMKREIKSNMFPCVFVGWDNTARRGDKGIIIKNSNPKKFRESLEDAYTKISGKTDDEKIIFINAWNEWAEGNHLEPCTKNGLTYLSEVKDFVNIHNV